MSDSKQKIDEFEMLLRSVKPAAPVGSPMQIMYLAGQQSANQRTPPNSSVRLWQFSTLVSSAVAAILLVMIFGAQTPEPIQALSPPLSPPLVQQDVVAGQADEPETQADPEPAEIQVATQPERGQPESGLAYFMRRRLEFSMQVANSRSPESSVEMFDDFEIQPIPRNRFGWERLQ